MPQYSLQGIHGGLDNAIDASRESQRSPPSRLRKGRRGCLDAHVIAMVAAETKMRHRNLSVGWVDYQKAFDMVPHPWLKQVLRARKNVRKAVESLVQYWRMN